MSVVGGSRLAVGARPDGVVRLLMREGTTLVVVGALSGVVVSAMAAHGLQSVLHVRRCSTAVAFVAAPVMLITVGTLAAFLPARRVRRVDPASALRVQQVQGTFARM